MVGHNPEFIIEVFDTFIEQTPFYLAELEDALSVKDWDKVGDCAHKIKPTFSYIGRNDVKEFMQAVEHHARERTAVEQIPNDIEHLKNLLTGIYAQLEDAKKNLKPKL